MSKIKVSAGVVPSDVLFCGGKHRHCSGDIEIALDRPVAGFSGTVILQAVSGVPDLFFQKIAKGDHPFKIDGFIHHNKAPAFRSVVFADEKI